MVPADIEMSSVSVRRRMKVLKYPLKKPRRNAHTLRSLKTHGASDAGNRVGDASCSIGETIQKSIIFYGGPHISPY